MRSAAVARSASCFACASIPFDPQIGKFNLAGANKILEHDAKDVYLSFPDILGLMKPGSKLIVQGWTFAPMLG